MSSICGLFSRNGTPVTREAIESMTETLAHWQKEEDRRSVWRNSSETLGLGQVMLVNTPESVAEVLPFHCCLTELAITADARIDNRNELFTTLEIPVFQQKTMPDSLLILESYKKWGLDCPRHLFGDFAFAIWDKRNQRLFCARDHLGVKPLFYFLSDTVFAFATEMKGIFTTCHLEPTPDPLWIADALTVHIANNEYTPYPQIRRLPPAHTLTLSPGGWVKECYWKPDPEKELRLSSDDEYVDAFRSLLNEAVQCRTRSIRPLGAELSGGLDSSVVTALAARCAQEKNMGLITFSHVREKNGGGNSNDESEYQAMVRRHAGIDHEYSLSAHDRGIIESLRRSIRIQDGPSHRVYGILTDVIHETAETEGIRSLFSGFGGDEVVTHPAGEYLHELMMRKAWPHIVREFIRHQAPSHMPLKTLFSFILNEYAPQLAAQFGRILNSSTKVQPPDLNDFIDRFPINPDFYASPSVRERIDAQSRYMKKPDVRASQCYRITHPSVAARLELCAIEAASRRMEYRYPLLDVRLIDFHLAVPSHLKRKNGYGRYLYRKAAEGVVPQTIQWRTDKTGATVPATRHRLNRDAREIEHVIRRGKKTPASEFINIDQMMNRFETFGNLNPNNGPFRQGVFFNALKLLVFFDDHH